jgi:hypothetical protein
MAHIHFGHFTYANNLGTANTAQRIVAWGNIDDNLFDNTDDGFMYEMAGCLDAPQRIPAGSTKCWESNPLYVSSSHINR